MAEVTAFIEFRLSGLRHANAHHSFEDLCRQVARQRLVSNVLPATGPVAGGGDQGRDFETFPTEAAGHERESSRFYALAAKEPTAFACTVQESGLKQKVKDDVTAICSQGMPVRRVYFFCTREFKVSVRHDVQRWAADKFEIDLQILDGPAIAELLADPELAWIGQRYLDIPAAMIADTIYSTPAGSSVRDDDPAAFAVHSCRQPPGSAGKQWLPPHVRRQHDVQWPLVSSANPVALGAHRALPGDGMSLPPYVTRDQDETLRSHLEQATAAGGLVVVTGQSAAGKTRSAAEMMIAVLGDRHLAAPDTSAEARQMAQAMIGLQETLCVLWLDDVDRFLSPDGLTPRLLQDLLERRTVVLATIRSERYAAIMTPVYSTRMGLQRPESHALGTRVLNQASLVSYDRMWTTEEVRRALDADDARLDQAAAVSKQYGIAEWLAAGPQMHHDLEAAWSPGSNPRGAALVEAAVELTRTGLYGPLPSKLVIGLHEYYLHRRHGHLLEPETLSEAITWATQFRHGTTRPLTPTPVSDTWFAFDYLVDIAERRNLPIANAAWRAALVYTQDLPNDRYRVGLRAEYQGNATIADESWRPLAEAGHGAAAVALGCLHDEEAEKWFRAAYAAGEADGAHNLGVWHMRQGLIEKAIQWYRTGADCGVESSALVLGQFYREREEWSEAARWFLRSYELGDTLDSLHEVASAYEEMGDIDKAEAWLLAGVEVGSYEALRCLAAFLDRQGDLDRAEEAYRILYESGEIDEGGSGLGIIQWRRGDEEGAQRFLCEALDHGSLIAAFVLDEHFRSGNGQPHDWESAVDRLLQQ